jgi:hypothetical protein
VGAFFESIVGGLEDWLGFGGFADLFDFGRGDHRGGVAEGISVVCQDGGNFLVIELFECG